MASRASAVTYQPSYGVWDDIFYPTGSAPGRRSWTPTRGFFPHGDDFCGLRVHQTRLQGRGRLQRLLLLHER